jgi:hypothetical protein
MRYLPSWDIMQRGLVVFDVSGQPIKSTLRIILESVDADYFSQKLKIFFQY